MTKQPPNQPTKIDPRQAFDPIYNVLTLICGVATVPLHCGFGSRGLAPYVYTVFFMIGYIGFGRCPQLALYLPVWMAMVAYRRCTIDKRQISNYRGYPYLACLLPFVSGEKQGRIVEPFLLFVLGIYLLPISIPLGRFMLGIGAAMFLYLLLELAAIEARKRSIDDDRKAAERWADLANGGNGFSR